MAINFDIRQIRQNNYHVLADKSSSVFCLHQMFLQCSSVFCSDRFTPNVLQSSNNLNSDEMIHEKCFSTMILLDALRDVACRWL